MSRLVVLVSGAGTNLQALLDACADPSYGAEVVAVGADRDGIEGLLRAEKAGVADVRLPGRGVRRAATTGTARCATPCAGFEPDLVVLAGFMKLVGPAFLAAFPGPVVNTHPALCPAFPGTSGPADALAYGVKVTGATLFVVDEGVDTGPIIAQTVVPVRGRRRRRDAARTDQGRRAADARRHRGPDRPRRFLHHRQEGADRPMSQAPLSQDRVPIRRALVSVYDKTGLEDLVRGLHEADVELVSTGGSAKLIADLGLPVTKVEDLTGFPECLDGRVKTLHPKVHAGILADRRLPDARGPARGAAASRRSTSWSPTSTRSPRR